MVDTTADDIVLSRARSYVNMGKYCTVVVFTTKHSEVDKLKYRFGGRSYRHGTGHVWMLSSRRELILLVQRLRNRFPSETGFEKKLPPIV